MVVEGAEAEVPGEEVEAVQVVEVVQVELEALVDVEGAEGEGEVEEVVVDVVVGKVEVGVVVEVEEVVGVAALACDHELSSNFNQVYCQWTRLHQIILLNKTY